MGPGVASMGREYSEIERTARDYYNSDDADAFYREVWGGEDLHLGIYSNEEESIFEASRRTVQRMAARVLQPLGEARVLDLGAGFGGTARYLAKQYGCRVTALNVSERENDRNRRMNHEQGVAQLIEVVDGTFESLPFTDAVFDVVWSQDALLHSGDRAGVLRQASRVLSAGGEILFTDPMQADGCPLGVLQPILERLHLASLGSPASYLAAARELGLEVIGFEDLTPHLTQHYTRVLQETTRREALLLSRISTDYLDRMKRGLGHWIDGGANGNLAWGLFHFQKP